jgi:hypothetical protein
MVDVESTMERRAAYRICVHGVFVKLHEEVGIAVRSTSMTAVLNRAPTFRREFDIIGQALFAVACATLRTVSGG